MLLDPRKRLRTRAQSPTWCVRVTRGALCTGIETTITIDRPLNRVRPNFLGVLRRGIETIRAMKCYALLLLAAPVNFASPKINSNKQFRSTPQKTKAVAGLSLGPKMLGLRRLPSARGAVLVASPGAYSVWLSTFSRRVPRCSWPAPWA